MVISDFLFSADNIVTFKTDGDGFRSNIFIDYEECKGLEYTGEEYGENTCDYLIEKIKRKTC